MISDAALQELAGRLVEIGGIEAVTLGGSRARGEQTPESDVDLGLYYRPPLDVEALGRLAREVAGEGAAVTRPGEWGPWVDGGGWLQIEGTDVDWIYRDLDRMHASWRDAEQGRFTFHFQVGHPLGVPDFAYAGEVALARILADPSGELGQLQEAARDYPPLLRQAVVGRLREATFSLGIARKAVTREDSAYVAGCLFRVVLLCAHALHADAGRWLLNEKGAIASAGRLPRAPADFGERAQRTCGHVGRSADELRDTLAAAQELLDATRAVCGAG
ncbi:nucleotidyltransferase domain-containing protein [Nocardioides sp. KR10-350]|uniref:nucleotidyltransferase family protein n=1 Tax=Nocardioides cheoyonin TaxID=3156615 RepID=UPI0032B54074